MNIENKNVQFKVNSDKELSKALQERLFELGYEWESSGKVIIAPVDEYIVALDNKKLRKSFALCYEHVDPIEFLLDGLNTEPIDYTGCDYIVKLCLERGLAVKCETESKEDFIFIYNSADSSHKYQGKNDFYRKIKPVYTKSKKVYYKKASEIFAWLEGNGDRIGDGWFVVGGNVWLDKFICENANKEFGNDRGVPQEFLEER